jgi:hypothetical protein
MVNELFMEINPELSLRLYSDNLDEDQKRIIDEILKVSSNIRTRLAGYHGGHFLKVLVFYKSYDDYNETVKKLMELIPVFCKPNLYINLTYYEVDIDDNQVNKRSKIYTGEEWRDELRTLNLFNSEDIELIKKVNDENINAIRLSDFMKSKIDFLI